MTGHSMGAALAQIAAAYYSDLLSPHLVTLAGPSIGNAEFCQFVNRQVQPCGGLRVWNEYDAIPYIALLIGYQHAGTPLKVRLKKSAKELFQNKSNNAIAATLDVVSPHILYQIGNMVHVFPVIGSEIGTKVDMNEFDSSINTTTDINRNGLTSIKTSSNISMDYDMDIDVVASRGKSLFENNSGKVLVNRGDTGGYEFVEISDEKIDNNQIQAMNSIGNRKDDDRKDDDDDDDSDESKESRWINLSGRETVVERVLGLGEDQPLSDVISVVEEGQGVGGSTGYGKVTINATLTSRTNSINTTNQIEVDILSTKVDGSAPKIDLNKSNSALVDFPVDMPFQPVFSVMEISERLDNMLIPDSYYDQFLDEKMNFTKKSI